MERRRESRAVSPLTLLGHHGGSRSYPHRAHARKSDPAKWVTSSRTGPKLGNQFEVALQGLQGLQGVQGFAAAQGLQGLHGLHGLAAAQGLQGLHGLAAAQGLHGLQDAAI